jgi:hypothetical protein
MLWLTRSDIILLVIAAYVAMMTLVRLMQRRRDKVIGEVQQQVKAHRKRAARSAEAQQSSREAA